MSAHDKRGTLQPRHPAMLHDAEAIDWLSTEMPHFELPPDARMPSVNVGPVNAVHGLEMLLGTDTPGSTVHVSGIPWLPGIEVSLRLPYDTHAAMRQTRAKAIMRSDFISSSESADLPSRISQLRSIGIPVVCWNQGREVEGKDGTPVVRQFRAYRCLVNFTPYDRLDPSAQPLILALHANMREYLARQVEWVETLHAREVQNLHATAMKSALRVAKMIEEGEL